MFPHISFTGFTVIFHLLPQKIWAILRTIHGLELFEWKLSITILVWRDLAVQWLCRRNSLQNVGYIQYIYIYVYIHTHTFTGCENGDRYQNSWDFMGYKYDQEFLIAYQIGYKTTYSFLLKKTLLGLYQTNTIWKIRTVGVWPSQKYGKAISCFLSSHMRHLKL